MKYGSQRAAFSLAEVLIALAVVVLTILSLTALSIALLRSSQKSTDQPVGVLVAERTLSEEIYKAQNDIPPGAKTNFWGNPWDVTPYKTGVIRTNETDYQYWLYAETLTDVVTGLPLGGATNRVKKVDIVVSWWGAQGGSRGGYGQLRYVANRLINEAP